MAVFDVVVILVTGLMVGCEVAIAVLFHATLDKLSDEAHLPAASALARVLGTVMPFWYAIGLFLIFAEAAIEWRLSGILSIWFAASAILWLLGLCIRSRPSCRSTTGLLPGKSPLRLPIGRPTGANGIRITAGVLPCSR